MKNRCNKARQINECGINAAMNGPTEDALLELGRIIEEFPNNTVRAADCLARKDGESYSDFVERCLKNALTIT